MPFDIRTRADDADKHSNDVTTLVYYKGKLYSGADDGMIKMWEEDLTLRNQIKAHQTSVFCLTIGNDTLYSCSNDGSIKAWTLDLKAKATLHKVDGEVWRVFYNKGVLYAGDDQGVVWIFEDDKLVSNLNTMEAVKGMQIDDKIIYTVRDLDVAISEITEKGIPMNRTTIMGRAPLVLMGDKMFFSSRDGKDILIHENSFEHNYKKLYEIKNAHTLIMNTLCASKSGAGEVLLYSGGWDKVAKQWQVKKDGVVPLNTCDVEMVINVLATGEKGEVYAGGSDGHIVRIDI